MKTFSETEKRALVQYATAILAILQPERVVNTITNVRRKASAKARLRRQALAEAPAHLGHNFLSFINLQQ